MDLLGQNKYNLLILNKITINKHNNVANVRMCRGTLRFRQQNDIGIWIILVIKNIAHI